MPKLVDGIKDMYVPMTIRRDASPHGYTPEHMRIIDELPENQKCEECKKTLWVCACNI